MTRKILINRMFYLELDSHLTYAQANQIAEEQGVEYLKNNYSSGISTQEQAMNDIKGGL